MTNFFMELSPVYQALLAGIFTWSITALGAAVVFFFKKVNNTIMNGMLGFSAGVMIAASFFSLIDPAIKMAESLNLISFVVVSIKVLFSLFSIIWILRIVKSQENSNSSNYKRQYICSERTVLVQLKHDYRMFFGS